MIFFHSFMGELYVTGGRQKERVFKTEEEWNLYDKALILRLDLHTGNAQVCVDYESPPAALADGNASILFKTGTQEGNKFYVCTSTEVLTYELPGFKRIGYISLPCFNDLHHVCPTPQGTLLVVSTGLDMVVEVTPEGEALREWNVLGEDPWERFSKQVDYRKVATTKPHRSHPNFVFQMGEDVWVTRAKQGDAVCLTRPNHRIEIGTERVHDGHSYGDKIYFTTVDGKLVTVDRNTLQISQVVDLKTIDNERKVLLGWCRGVMVADDTRVWVGFTRVRKTKFQENVLWVKHVFRELEKPTHIALYDIAAGKILNEIDLERHRLNVLFSIFPAV